jgi:hypothetical protein
LSILREEIWIGSWGSTDGWIDWMGCRFISIGGIGRDEMVYIEMPQGFKQYDKNGKPKVLKLNRTLCLLVVSY